MGLAWLKSLTIKGGQANVIAHLDHVLSMLTDGRSIHHPSFLTTCASTTPPRRMRSSIAARR